MTRVLFGKMLTEQFRIKIH